VGQKGRREEVSEWRLEVICPEAKVSEAVRAMRGAHSYEEPAFDVYPLRPVVARVGVGRVGLLPASLPMVEFGRLVSRALGTRGVHVVEAGAAVRRVAIVCGAGGDLIGKAAGQADALVTGEARFHDCLRARALGVSLVLAGHHATERCGVVDLAERIRREFAGLEVWASVREQDPLRWLDSEATA
jgi:putative NIF3 family GTP cyclohydrolase 1 type 2